MLTTEQLASIALRYDTLMAYAILKALGVHKPEGRPETRDRSARSRKYRGARKLMMQRHGVRL